MCFECFEKCNEAHEVMPQLSELQIALQSICVAMIDDGCARQGRMLKHW